MDELAGGIRRVTMPLPMRPGHVHTYLVPVEDGFMLVDAGLGLPDARGRWEAELAGLPGPVTTLFLTHFHPDHLGASRDVHELTGARVVQGRLDAEQTATVWQDGEWSSVLAGWFRANGVPPSVTDELLQQGTMLQPFLRIVSNPDLLDDGDELHGWRLVAAPGHADGQLTLLRDGILLAADHLLDPITPAIGLWPESRPDPLGDYIDALQRTVELAPRLAYAGHGEPIADPSGRARALMAHHEERLAVTSAALGPEPLTGYEVSFPVFGADLPPGSRRFAVAETLSHLERLVRLGAALRHEEEVDGAVAVVSYTAAH